MFYEDDKIIAFFASMRSYIDVSIEMMEISYRLTTEKDEAETAKNYLEDMRKEINRHLEETKNGLLNYKWM